MSQLWTYVKTNMRANAKQWMSILALYVVMPIFFSLLMGFSFSSAFVPEQTSNPVEVSINNEDQGEVGQVFIEAFSNETMHSYVDIVESHDDSNFVIHLQPEYSQRLEDTLVSIEAKENASASEEAILTQLITSFQSSLVNQLQLGEELGAMSDQATVDELIDSLNRASQLSSEQVFVKEQYESQSALTSNQYISVSGLVYIFILSLAGSIGLKTNEDMKGLRKRIGVLPLTPAQDVIYGIISDTLTYTFLASLYMVIWRFLESTAFVGNPLFYLGWIVIYAFLFQVLNSILYYFIPDKYVNLVYLIITSLYMILGFLPIDRLIGGEFGEIFSQNYYREIFSQPMFDYILNNDWTSNIGIAVGIVLVSVTLIFLVIQLRNRRELKPI